MQISSGTFTNTGNLQTFVCELIISIGQSRASSLWWLFSLFFILLLLLLTCYSAFLKEKLSKKYIIFDHPYIFCIAISLTIFVLRFPHLSRHELNVDETQWMASAITLAKDGRFWLSVDNATSGPLISAPLLIIQLLGASINYGTVKLFGIFTWISSFIFIYFGLRLYSDEANTRFILIPPVICVASFTFSDYIAYNSEHIPILMLSACAYLSILLISKKKSRSISHVVALGLILGCIPYSKLQTVPIALGIALYTLPYLDRKYNTIFILSGLFPTLITFLYLLSTGIVQDFWISYIINNLHYAREGMGHNLTLLGKIRLLPQRLFSEYTTDTSHFFIAYFSLSLLVLAVLLTKFRKWILKKEYSLIGFTLLLVLSSLYSVIQSGSYFEHYFLLLILPFTLLLGTLLGILFTRISYLYSPVKRYFYLVLFILSFTTSLTIYYSNRNSVAFTRVLANYNLSYRISKVSEIILANTSKHDRISVWGWASEYYVETQLAQGNRDTHTLYQIKPGKFQEYYLNRYSQDILKNKPVFFINAISDKHFVFQDTSKYSYYHYPQIKAVVDSLYTYVAEVEGASLFILKSKRQHITTQAEK